MTAIDQPVQLRLYIVGDAPNSIQAVANLTAICREHLDGRYRIEIVDVLIEPHRALEDGVLLTPTVVVAEPAPLRRIVGNLSQPEILLQALGIPLPTP